MGKTLESRLIPFSLSPYHWRFNLLTRFIIDIINNIVVEIHDTPNYLFHLVGGVIELLNHYFDDFVQFYY